MSLLDSLLLTVFNAVICITLPKLISMGLASKNKYISNLSNSVRVDSEAESLAEPVLSESVILP